MLLLALETATAQVGVALGSADGALGSFHSTRARRHAETLAPAIDFVCRQAGVGLDALTAVAVDVGPGQFTGLRVGLVTAKAIAFARGIPLVPVCSLDALAHPARLDGRRVVAVLDARRGEVYHASYQRDASGPGGDLTRLGEPAASRPQDLADRLRETGKDCLLVGDGAHAYAETFATVPRVEVAGRDLRYPSAAALLDLAAARAAAGTLVPESEVEALYLRAADAVFPAGRGGRG
ncbi:MAG TPA: tRNA (adenosine(37)-N6)-threonylcarbamoyltransferase complex dimerization subunit type 1 TsaB [Thermoanaerobaculia bacterium]|nr:tRNA (adenosine(37)-N6)-threonylcarbamoyltransferase complex dimerization subunit type 1 TsaB [Thermoanaerobaculia bacterium]